MLLGQIHQPFVILDFLPRYLLIFQILRLVQGFIGIIFEALLNQQMRKLNRSKIPHWAKFIHHGKELRRKSCLDAILEYPNARNGLSGQRHP